MRTLAITLLTLTTVAATARADGAGALTTTTTGWRWSRAGVSIDLKHRGSRWTADEVALVQAALDKLPDVLLRKATSTGTRTFYRDPRPVGLDGVRGPTVIATTVVEKGYISFGDGFLEGMDPRRVYFTTTHELGHATQYAMIGGNPVVAKLLAKTVGTAGWTSISWTAALTEGLKSYNGFVSDYARTNDREDFAESVEFYWINPAELRRVNPAKFAYMRDRVFEGQASPAAARDLDHRAIDAVRPVIERLGDTVDENYSLVKVHGTYFMGPLDGGFNAVRYRGTKALHLPVSRSTVWSWVPGISAGQAPVTVTTQDGRSDPASFRVERPWWKFW